MPPPRAPAVPQARRSIRHCISGTCPGTGWGPPAPTRAARACAKTRAIAVPEFRDRLSRITSIGRSVLGEIERDPRDAARARRFLNLYLDSAERVTLDYARSQKQMRNEPVERNFRRLLVDIESTFAEQHRMLVARDLLSLDVDIEVLNTRLKREGLG